ncbi:ubiquitin carboxyl-terminal hydrolase 42 isoform X5 [Hydra vulgaris]|uniref:Ubiquitin carboxyl-terminal hydrolase n=1 Tax=Hydra vulgaris TaxID=6087 RepID=A0ABM4CDC6_HYDVU
MMVSNIESFYESTCAAITLDKQISASAKKVLLEHIVFKEACKPDITDQLSSKYKPVNAGYMPRKIKCDSIVNNPIPKPSVVLYPEENVEIKWKAIQKIGPGLANLGNTCFLNSVLQVLTYTPPLFNYIMSEYHKQKCGTVGFCMQCELTNHFIKVFRGNTNGAIKPMSIIQKLQFIGKSFRFGRQEDAHEFLRYVVEAIQKSDYVGRPNLDKFSKETSVANAIFGGLYRSQVKCLKCNFDSNTFETMMDINLDVKDCSTVIQALQRSVCADRLEGDNKYYCERCRMKTVAQKRNSIYKEPNVLTLQLKRFDFTNMFGGKISKNVVFPEELDIRPFMSVAQNYPLLYKLYAVLVHSGFSCNSGHYYCYVKASNSAWYEMNDNRVCQVGIQTVLNAQAYLLFYIKKDGIKHGNTTMSCSNLTTTISCSNLNTTMSCSNLNTGNDLQKNDLNDLSHKNLNGNKNEKRYQISIDKEKYSANQLERKYSGLQFLNQSYSYTSSSNSSASPSPVYSDRNTVKEEHSIKSKQPVKDKINHEQLVKKIALNDERINNEPSPKCSRNDEVHDYQAVNQKSFLQDTKQLKDTKSVKGEQSAKDELLAEDGQAIKNISSKTYECNSSDFNKNIDTFLTKENPVSTPTEVSFNKKSLFLPLSDAHNQKMKSKASPTYRLKLFNGKYFNRKKFAVWSPITKATIHQRIIINKYSSDPDLDRKKDQGVESLRRKNSVDLLKKKKKKKKKYMEDDDWIKADIRKSYEKTQSVESKKKNCQSLILLNADSKKKKQEKNVEHDFLNLKNQSHEKVPCHKWDAEKKNEKMMWNGCAANVVSYLDVHAKVSSWSGEDSSTNFRNIKITNHDSLQDEWDEDYDKGRVKKYKSNDVKAHSCKNVFQNFQDIHNASKTSTIKYQPHSSKHKTSTIKYQTHSSKHKSFNDLEELAKKFV